MAITTVGFDGTITEAQWSQIMLRASEIGYRHGIWTSSRQVVTATGTRAVSAPTFDALIAGVWVVSDTAVTFNLAANTGQTTRVDYVVVEVNWATNTAALKVITGSSSTAPALTQNAGSLWQMPLARVNVKPGTTTLFMSDLEDARPLPRKVRIFRSPRIVNEIAGATAGTVVGSIDLSDPGWPYRLDVTAQLRFKESPGQTALMEALLAGGTTLGATISPYLTRDEPAVLAAVSDVLTGPTTVRLRITRSDGAGPIETRNSAMNDFIVRQIPA